MAEPDHGAKLPADFDPWFDPENLFDVKYRGWSRSDLALPEGMTEAQMETAQDLVVQFVEADPLHVEPLILELWAVFARGY